MYLQVKYRLIISLALFVLLTSLREDIRFSRIDMQTGLSNNSVLCLLQDHDGFIWIGTRDGLNRFDGIDYTVYKHEFDDSLSISNNQINCIFEASNKELNEPEDPLKSKLNPLFISATSSESNWKAILRFLLQPQSPDIDNGIIIKGHPSKDFAGNPVIGKPDRGAFEVIRYEK